MIQSRKEMKAMLPNKVYDVLKWIALIALPAVATLWLTLGQIWAFPYVNEIGATIIAIDTFLGALLGVSTITYRKGDE